MSATRSRRRARPAPPARRTRPPSRPAPGPPAAGPRETARFRLPDGTRSERSPWVWRALFFMSLIALGFSVSLFTGGKDLYGAAWAAIAAGWLGVSLWLWRRHHLATS